MYTNFVHYRRTFCTLPRNNSIDLTLPPIARYRTLTAQNPTRFTEIYMKHPFDLPGYVPHDYQYIATNLVLSQSERYQLIAGPTGTGKSYVELAAHRGLFPSSWLITPRIEIMAGMADKIGVEFDSLESLVSQLYALQITTPIRFRNAMIEGRLTPPQRLLIDESHHESAASYQELITCISDDALLTGFTATPFRGTPKQTAEFRLRWGEPKWMITYREAIEGGYLSFPECDTWGLVDDDVIEVSNTGEFVVNKLTAATNDKMYDALKKSKDYGHWNPDGTPRRPMLISIPSAGVIESMQKHAKDLGLKIYPITDETPWKARQMGFAGCVHGMFALAHINTVSEGVDLPIRIHLDLSPTLSPVMFSQRFGRTTRPILHEDGPEYICTNRNLERHGYLFDGILPPSKLAKFQGAFDNPSERVGYRAFGLTSLGKCHGFRMRLTDGLTITCYNITQMEGHRKHEYFAVAHPSYANPLYFYKASTKVSVQEDRTQYDWGKWELLNTTPPELTGFRSQQAKAVTDNQKQQWDKWAERVGLVPTQPLNTRNIQAMFVLRDAKASLV